MPTNRYRVTVTVTVDADDEQTACAIACRGMTGLELGVPDVDEVQEVDYSQYETTND